MGKGLKWFGALGLLLAIALGAYWYAASRWFAELAQSMAPVVELEYASSFAWPFGRAGIRQIRLRPVLAPTEEVVADSMSFSAGDPLVMFNLFWRGNIDPPPALSIRIERLRVSASTERRLREQASRLGFLAPFEALGCNDQGRFGGADYAELGWLQASTDFDISYRYSESGGDLYFSVAHDMAPLARLEIELDADGIIGGMGSMFARAPQLRRFLARYDDRGMLGQRNEYCARRLSVSPDVFVDRHVAAVRAELEALGLFPDEPLVELYRAFAARGGRLELTAAPSATVSISDYGHYSAEDRLRLFNAGISHDGGARIPVTARFFTAGAGAESVAAPATTTAIRAQATDADTLLIEELPELIGSRISISTHQGVDYAGTLIGVRGSLIRLQVETRVGRPQTVVLNQSSIASMRLIE
jgi:hypothetical protein